MWIPAIYVSRVRAQRTRAVALPVPGRENRVDILHTLLGIELKIGSHRLACPDLATARYLRVFARLGCAEIAVPYDITRISPLADEFETAWQRTLLLIASGSAGLAERSSARLRSSVIKMLRHELAEAGAGAAMPAFKTTTRQRTD